MNKIYETAERNKAALDTRDLLAGLKGRTVRGGIINLSAQIVSVILQIGSIAIFARLLQPADYGLLAMAASVIAFAALFTNMGLTTPTIQRQTITPNQVSTLFYITVAGGVIVALISCLTAPFFVHLFHNKQTQNILWLMSLTIIMGAIGAQFNAVLVRRMEWTKIQLINLTSQTAGIILGLLLAWKAGIGVYALVAQQLTGSAVSLILTIAFCRWRPTLVFSMSEVRTELSMGMDMLFFGIFNYLHRQFDNVLIGARWGAVELGLYSRAYNVMSQANFGLIGPLGTALVPSLSRVSDNPDRWRHHFTIAAAVMATCVGFIFAVLFANCREIVEILFGDRWHGVTALLYALLVAGLCTAVCSPFSWIFPSLGHTRRQLIWSIISAPILIAAFWFGNYYKALGVATAYAATMFVINFLYIHIATYKTPVGYGLALSVILPVYLGFAAIGALSIWGVPQFMAEYNVFVRVIVKSALVCGLFGIWVGGVSLVLPAYALARRSIISDVRAWFVARSGARS